MSFYFVTNMVNCLEEFTQLRAPLLEDSSSGSEGWVLGGLKSKAYTAGSVLHPGQHYRISLKLIHGPDQTPSLDRNRQTPEMCSYFVTLLNLNQNLQTYHTHSYFEAKLQKVISVQVLYNTGANISCISSHMFHSLLPDRQPMH